MSTRKQKLSKAEIADALAAGPVGPIISPAELAKLCGLSVYTIYEWAAKGRLDGAYRRRGKHALIWRDRAIAILFNGPEWQHSKSRKAARDSNHGDSNET